MAELRQFKLPDVGEGLTEADIVRWHVQPGDTVKVNQIIVEIETAKAVVELPSPHAGVVSSLLVNEGETVDVGTPIIAIDTGAADGTATSAPAAGAGAPAPDEVPVEVPPLQTPTSADLVPPPPAGAAGEETGKRQAVLVGYGVKLGSTARRPRKAAVPDVPAPERPAAAAPAAPPATATPAAPQAPAAPAAATALAKPPVRKLARDLGVDLAALAGTGPNGSITRDDVEAATVAPATPASATPADRTAAPRASAQPGGEERVPVRGVRKHTAAAMTSSAFTAPHVTMFLEIDITETMAATARLRELPDFSDVRVSPLLLVAKALLVAAARHPMINSTWDEAAQEIVVKHYVNLGIAAATDRGLVVPSIKDAHLLSLPDLARALAELAAVARAGRSTPADLADGTISITNVGVFGVDTGTPILPPGQAMILAFGQVKNGPWVRDGQLTVRQVCTLSMSFDHRIVDGDLGAAALRDIGAMLADPLHMLAWS
ncbi:MAG TPA: dihydrolipoamide acetyltransferase family protein [Streptosporangiaceae bacterium]|jgi:pyruvate dehydrogenase E2 component (dihydrolipoamide acetyltransferase)